MPPPEPSKVTRAYFGNANFFGGPSTTSLKNSGKLKLQEEQNPDAMMVFLSDVWLDQARVMEKLRVMFAGFCEEPPICFVLMGNFLSGGCRTGTTTSTNSGGTTSTTSNASPPAQLRKHFRQLAELIREFPALVEQSKFVFVPGPADSGFSNILPK